MLYLTSQELVEKNSKKSCRQLESMIRLIVNSQDQSQDIISFSTYSFSRLSYRQYFGDTFDGTPVQVNRIEVLLLFVLRQVTRGLSFLLFPSSGDHLKFPLVCLSSDMCSIDRLSATLS